MTASADAGCDVLAFGPHPDDVELACGGWLLGLTAAGRRVVVCDLTRGESGSRGDGSVRMAEAEEACRRVRLHARENLGLPDGGLRDDDATVTAIVGMVRKWRPRLLLVPDSPDPHPDHEAAARACRRAWFLSGLRQLHTELGAAWRPPTCVSFPGNEEVDVTFCIDVSDRIEAKAELIRAYASQLEGEDRSHFLRGRDILERARVRDAWWGLRIGVRAAEPYRVDGPLPIRDPLAPLA